MNRSEYLSIRNKVQIKESKLALPIHFALDLGLILAIAGIWGSDLAIGFKVLAAPLLSVLIFRSFSVMHEAVHGLLSKKKAINSALGIMYGGLGLLPYEQWKVSHIKHHHWSGNIEKDPVMGFLVAYPKMSRGFKKFLEFCWKTWVPVFGLSQHIVFWTLSIKELRSTNFSVPRILSVLSSVIVWGSLAILSPPGFLLFGIIPAIVIYLMGTEVINLPHHLQVENLTGEKSYKAWDQHHTARSCVYPAWISQLITLNFNLHAEHHMYPDAPWYLLSEIHEEVKKSLSGEMLEDSQFNWIIENRKKPLEQVLFPDGLNPMDIKGPKVS